jgi:hypothetical protein
MRERASFCFGRFVSPAGALPINSYSSFMVTKSVAPYSAYGSFTRSGTAKAFHSGVTLAWIPFLFLYVFGLRNTFRGIAASQATGLGVVAGGLAEGFATFGFAAMLVMQVTAAVLLVRSFSKDYWGRSIVAIASLICSAITSLMIVALIGMRFYFGQ